MLCDVIAFPCCEIPPKDFSCMSYAVRSLNLFFFLKCPREISHDIPFNCCLQTSRTELDTYMPSRPTIGYRWDYIRSFQWYFTSFAVEKINEGNRSPATNETVGPCLAEVRLKPLHECSFGLLHMGLFSSNQLHVPGRMVALAVRCLLTRR